MKQKLQSLFRKVFLGAEGELRPAWRVALGILLTLAAYSAVLYGLAALFGALFDAWGLTTANLTRAPHWAQSVVRWHSDFCYALAYGAGIAVGLLWSRRFFAKLWRRKGSKLRNIVPLERRTAGEASSDDSSPAHANGSSQTAKQRGESTRTADRPASARSAALDKAAANETSCVPEARARRKPVLCAILLGLLLSGGLGALALTTDCMRLESPWSRPHFALSQLSALLVLALGRLLSEVVTKRLCFDELRPRSRCAAWILSVALATLLNLRTLSVLGALNALLLAAVGCALYERGGLTASASLQIVWTAVATLLLGFPGMSASAVAVWPIYHVSDAWLTGGSAGPMSGAWFTLLLTATLLLLLHQPLTAALSKLKSHAKHSPRQRDRLRECRACPTIADRNCRKSSPPTPCLKLGAAKPLMAFASPGTFAVQPSRCFRKFIADLGLFSPPRYDTLKARLGFCKNATHRIRWGVCYILNLLPCSAGIELLIQNGGLS